MHFHSNMEGLKSRTHMQDLAQNMEACPSVESSSSGFLVAHCASRCFANQALLQHADCLGLVLVPANCQMLYFSLKAHDVASQRI